MAGEEPSAFQSSQGTDGVANDHSAQPRASDHALTEFICLYFIESFRHDIAKPNFGKHTFFSKIRLKAGIHRFETIRAHF